MIIFGVFTLVVVTIFSFVWLIEGGFNDIRNKLIIPTLIGISLITLDIYLARTSNYIIKEKIVTTQYDLYGNKIYFPIPTLVKVYEKDCTGLSLTKENYRYITIGEKE